MAIRAYLRPMRKALVLFVVIAGCAAPKFTKVEAYKTRILPGMEDGTIETTYYFSMVPNGGIENIGTIYMDGWESYRTNEDEPLAVEKGDTVIFKWQHYEPTPSNTDHEEIFDLASIMIKGDSTYYVMYSIRQSSMPRDYVFKMHYNNGRSDATFTIDTLDWAQTIAMP